MASSIAFGEGETHYVAIHVDQNDPKVMNMALNNAVNVSKFYESAGDTPADASVRMTAETMWRFLMKQTRREDVRAKSETLGAPELVAPFFEAVAVMA